jgi:hypothetical protein
MGAEPARSDHVESRASGESGFGGARVFDLHRRRPSPRPNPDQTREEVSQTGQVESGSSLASRLTLRNIPGDWGSVTTAWTDTPDSIQTQWATIAGNLRGGDPTNWAIAGWLTLALPARAILHLASWVAAHPARIGAVALPIAVVITIALIS